MIETYRKHGTVVRWDHGLIVRIDEAGEAIEEGDFFLSRPIDPATPLPPIDLGMVEAAAGEIQGVAQGDVVIERAIVSEGFARHQIEGNQWEERTRRVHLSLVHRSARLRAMLDSADFDVQRIAAIADALARVEGEGSAGNRLRLAGNVTAALLPSMVRQQPAGVRFFQTAGGVDGRGLPILDRELTGEPWPNWYRPSYRVRPLRAPLNVRALCSVGSVDASLPQAIALLAPPIGRDLRLLCTDASRVFTATVVIRRIRAAGAPVEWFPYGAGAWGADMELEVE